jgi:hypothetical protein
MSIYLLQGCSRHCYTTELQFAAAVEKASEGSETCMDLGWLYHPKEEKLLRLTNCFSSTGEVTRFFEQTDKGLCEVKYLADHSSW